VIALIEDAIKARLAGAGLPYLRTVATYAGQFDGELHEVVRAFPAVWTAFRGDGPGRATGTSRAGYRLPAVWVVLCGARNLRSEEAARHGGPAVMGRHLPDLADVGAALRAGFGLPIVPLAGPHNADR
jgi:phage gp37-like protein